jgi:hypothetical protein
VTFDVHTLVVASMLLDLGSQSTMFAVLTATYAIRQRFRPSNRRVELFFKIFTLERGAIVGLAGIVLGFLVILAAGGVVPLRLRPARLRDDDAGRGAWCDDGHAGYRGHPE